jgi:hypothetical protein
MITDREEIMQMIHDFQRANVVIGINEDDLKVFFESSKQVGAFKHEVSASNSQRIEILCKDIRDELHVFAQTNKIKDVLLLAFVPAKHDLLMGELINLTDLGLSNDISFTWGYGTYEGDKLKAVLVLSNKL